VSSPALSDEVLSAEQVAELLHVDVKTLYGYVNRGQLPHRRIGRRIIFGRRAILDWLNKPVNDAR
jgi:excisionase family DNA binding protein